MFRWVYNKKTEKRQRQVEVDLSLGEKGFWVSEAVEQDAVSYASGSSSFSYYEDVNALDGPRKRDYEEECYEGDNWGPAVSHFPSLPIRQSSSRQTSQRLSVDGDSLCSAENADQTIRRRIIDHVVSREDPSYVTPRSVAGSSPATIMARTVSPTGIVTMIGPPPLTIGSQSPTVSCPPLSSTNSIQPPAAVRRRHSSIRKKVPKKRMSPPEFTAHSFDSREFVDSEDDNETVASQNSVSRRLRNGGSTLHSALQQMLPRNIRAGTRLRGLVGTFFVYLVIGLPFVVFLTSRTSQRKSMEHQFFSLAAQVTTEFGEKIAGTVSAIDALSVTATSAALTAQNISKQQPSWPFVTIWDFDLQGENALQLSNTVLLSFHPLVPGGKQKQWESYAMQESGWLSTAFERGTLGTPTVQESGLPYSNPIVWTLGSSGEFQVKNNTGNPCLPMWQYSPPVNDWLLNYDILADDSRNDGIQNVFTTKQAILDRVERTPDLSDANQETYTQIYTQLFRAHQGDNTVEYRGEPVSWVHYPVFDSFQDDTDAKPREVVGVINAIISWESFFQNILPPSSENGVHCILKTSCGDAYTFEISGEGAVYLGEGDLHERGYDYLEQSITISQFFDQSSHQFAATTVPIEPNFCPYSVSMYPTDELQGFYITYAPLWRALALFLFLIFMFVCMASYDWVLQRKIQRVWDASQENQEMVAQIFPEQVRKRLLETGLLRSVEAIHESPGHAEDESIMLDETENGGMTLPPKAQLRSLLRAKGGTQASKLQQGELGTDDINVLLHAAPIADLFPFCTVCFVDIAGFSAWCSEREPEQVFTLLEAVFQTMDAIARKRGIFKVETISDSYLAVTGLPDPQKDHALRMARFARDCMVHVHNQTRLLETSLGPDTGELRLRVGLHSGQVTAGVLLGSKSRFQLFGDTVNTASRMESTSQRNRIQVSETTARLLQNAGKAHWLNERSESVHAKGKGVMKTFWLSSASIPRKSDEEVDCTSIASQTSVPTDSESVKEDEYCAANVTANGTANGEPRRSTKQNRLIDWLVELLAIHLKDIVRQRSIKMETSSSMEFDIPLDPNTRPDAHLKKGAMVLDEVIEAFVMPKKQKQKAKFLKSSRGISIDLPPKVRSQLRHYIAAISDRYHSNPFHNFDHCAHVTMSAVKLLKRIVNSDDAFSHNGRRDASADLHSYTYGITSDALSRFAVVFCALIHDVDHTGVPNPQLAKEDPELGARYRQQSVAEQNSVDISWNLLMSADYRDLQACIFGDFQSDVKRFRQYVVNLVIATDIFNPRLKALRNSRWEKAFEQQACEWMGGPSSDFTTSNTSSTSDSEEGQNLKATIVLEHIIQAADVSHTMQHWNVYKKWNERLFNEMYVAYKTGRLEKDPSEGWYAGELWFFDNYIIPLAKKLEACGVFGVSSDECLNYSIENRKEWSLKGHQVVREMVERYEVQNSYQISGNTIQALNQMPLLEMESTVRDFITRAQKSGTLKTENFAGQKDAAQCWLNAFLILDKCSAAKNLDAKLFFPVYSGLLVFLKGNIILQDQDQHFEWNLAHRFLKQARKEGTDIDIARALACQCDLLARDGQYQAALDLLEEVKSIYAPRKQSSAMSTMYGTDRATQMLAQSALWLLELGEDEKALITCNYILDGAIPNCDPANVLNSFEILFPIIKIMKEGGKTLEIRPVFFKSVIEQFREHRLKYSLCRPIFMPILSLLDICHFHESNLEADPNLIRQAMQWLLADGGNTFFDPFLDGYYSKLGWAPNTILAELCYHVALNLNKSCIPEDMHTIKKDVVRKGLKAAQLAATSINMGCGGKPCQIPLRTNEAVANDLKEMAADLGINVLEVSRRRLPRTITPILKNDDPNIIQTTLGVVRVAS